MKKTMGIISVMVLIMLNNVTGQGLKVGDKAPDFSLKSVNEQKISLNSLKDNKGAIVIFTCNHCPFSKAYEDRIITIDKTFRSQGYPVIAINPNDPVLSPEDSFEKMQERSSEKGFPFAYVYDETQSVAKAYGATRTPHVYLLRMEGENYVVKYIGAIDDNVDEPENVKSKYLEDAVNQLINDGKVALQETKAIGCTIKWKQ
ncbi:MAG: thioredoxin family protein [Bacteroidota bacterium]